MALLLSAGVAPSSAAPSPAPAHTPVPRELPDFSSMKFLLGTWTCRGIVRGKNRPDTSTATIGMDGAYMITHDVAPPFDKYRTRAVVTHPFLTYNSITHIWLPATFDTFDC